MADEENEENEKAAKPKGPQAISEEPVKTSQPGSSSADEDIEKTQADDSGESGDGSDDDLDLDDDLANALDVEAATDIDVVSIVDELAPEFSSEMSEISTNDFKGVVISKDAASEEVDEAAKAPSAYRAFIDNIPKDLKNRYKLAGIVVIIMIPIAVLVLNGKLLPRFEIPYKISMDEISKEVTTYDTSEPEVPLFDQYRNRGHIVSLPRTMINLKVDGERSAYAQFEFKFSVRDEEYIEIIKKRESEVLDLMQGVLAQITLAELQTPMGKEKVKKVIRHRLNTFLQGNFVLGVYYHTILVNK